MPTSIDLHGLRVDEAIAKVDKFLDDALAAGLLSVRLVHGHGTGALRRAICDHLREYPPVRHFRPGAPNEGGGSVTVVEF
jgi:DNA mismatch repair protein MutS2